MAKQDVQAATKHEASNASAPKAEKGSAGKGGGNSAPRPRKWDYGIQPENKVSALKTDTEVKLKSGEDEGYTLAKKGCTVQTFLDKSSRSVLRRLGRKKLLQVTAPNGTTYPRTYVAPPPKVKKEKAAEAA